MSQPATIPLSLYVHIPWCVRKCPYCDFNSHPLRGEIPETNYLAALIADLEQDIPRVSGRLVSTIFLGGGTPSLLSASAVQRLLTQVRHRLPVAAGAEITLEANPGTVEQGRFADLRAAGVNRLSLGIQSFDDACLTRLGRIHDRKQALHAVESARAAGFDNLNLDLMFGLPGQTVTQAEADIALAVALAPNHISYYQLTIEPNTLFNRTRPRLPDDDRVWEMQQAGQTALAQAGLARYEVSAYARPGAECRHNRNYWEFGDYLGIGAGAHAKVTDPDTATISRFWKLRHPRDYMECTGTPHVVGGESTLGPAQAVTEFMMNALRLTRGFPESLFQARTGLPLSAVANLLRQAETRHWMIRDGTHWRATALGGRFLDSLLELFVEAEP